MVERRSRVRPAPVAEEPEGISAARRSRSRQVIPIIEEKTDVHEVPATEDDSPDEIQPGETEEQAANRIVAKYKAQARSPSKAIRAFCVFCMGGQVREVGRCTATHTCPLWPFRYGRNPFHGRAVNHDNDD